jgi:transketolase
MNEACRQIRRDLLAVAYHSGNGHLPTCFSVVEMIYAAYGVMKHDPANPKWEQRDLFILSKGHAALALYSVLGELGYFPPEDVFTLGRKGSIFGCHPDRTKIPGIEASTGSLGHGIGLATGMALAFKIQKCERRVFTLVGDGESNEGSVWEAVMVAAHQKLSNLTVLYDDNRSHARGLPIENPAERFRAFGCEVDEVDGHDVDALKAACAKQGETVRVVVARTVKGHGCKTLVDNVYEWHRRSPNDAEMPLLLEELNARPV